MDKIYICGSCRIEDKEVECGGIYYCPNPLCHGCGAAWFRRKLDSYKEDSNQQHSIDEKELCEKGLLYIEKLNSNLKEKIIKTISKPSFWLAKELKMSKEDRGLFEIHAINKDTDDIVFHEKVVAEAEKEALYESNLKDKLKELKLRKDDVHLIVNEIGTVPAKEDVKTVKILGNVGKTSLVKEQ